MTWTEVVSAQLGVADEGLRLILGQWSGYPLFLLHRQFLRKSSPALQHAFFALSGMAISYWSIGIDAVFHSSACILATWATINLFKGSTNSTIFMYIFQMGYLCTGYYFKASSGYDINWTMPGCVLCLRMIGLAVDVYDGTKKDEELSKDQKESALRELPSILEMFSHAYFIGGYFVGPQFSMRKYQNFINRNIEDDLPPSRRFAFKRFGIGCCYMLGHLLGDKYVAPVGLVETPAFHSMNIFVKSFYFSLWVKIILAKYISAWLFAEGAVILSGLGYNGKWEDGSIKWNGGANVKLRVFEASSRFQHLIDSFNINTNAWVMSYVYKRLRFLNNKMYSQLGALGFLALWHGWHSGYYLTFFNEFVVMNFEKNFFPMVDQSPMIQRLNENPAMRFVFWCMGKIYLTIFLPHCFLPFSLLKSAKYIPALMSTYCLHWLFCASFFVWRPIAKMILKPQRPEKKEN